MHKCCVAVIVPQFFYGACVRTPELALWTRLDLSLAGCSTTPIGVDGPGSTYSVSRSHYGFTGTQALRFGAYRVEMRFDGRSGQAKPQAWATGSSAGL